MVVDEFPSADDVDNDGQRSEGANSAAAVMWPVDGAHDSWATKDLFSTSLAPDLAHLQPASKKFFSHGGTVAGGASYLVARSQLRDENARSGTVVKEDVDLMMQLAELVVTLTQGQQDSLGSLLGKLMKRESNVSDVSTGKIHARIPTTRTEFRNFILEGKHAIVPNLPTPAPEVATAPATAASNVAAPAAGETRKACP